MFWQKTLATFKKNKLTPIKLKDIKWTWFSSLKLKIIFKKFNIKDVNYSHVEIIVKYLRSKRYEVIDYDFTINYNNLLFSKHMINDFESKKNINVLFNVTLNRKQTFVNITHKNKKIHYLSNGILLKEKGILEKEKKKDQKASLLNIITTLDLISKKLKNEIVIVSIKKTRPFVNKICKLIVNSLNTKVKKLILIIIPCISFNHSGFKKIKSIKKKFRKKEKIINV